MSEEEATLIGTLERIKFRNPEDGFLIGTFLEEKSKNSITIKGHIIGVKDSQTLQLKGLWEIDPKYGKQFRIKESMPIEPTNREGILSYLSSGDFPGIGPKTAERIFEQLISVKEGREDQRGYREVMTFLGSLGITEAFKAKIYAKYGLNCISLIKENPFDLTEIKGIAFVMADNIARNLGFDQNSPKRAACALVYMLEQEAQNGHTCFPQKTLLDKTIQEMHKSTKRSD